MHTCFLIVYIWATCCSFWTKLLACHLLVTLTSSFFVEIVVRDLVVTWIKLPIRESRNFVGNPNPGILEGFPAAQLWRYRKTTRHFKYRLKKRVLDYKPATPRRRSSVLLRSVCKRTISGFWGYHTIERPYNLANNTYPLPRRCAIVSFG